MGHILYRDGRFKYKIFNCCYNDINMHNRNDFLLFNEKITHMSKRTTRDKLLSYLSAESLRQGKLSFTIPYDRQQLADFLCVERSAMSAELSKLQKEGLLEYQRNAFTLFS